MFQFGILTAAFYHYHPLTSPRNLWICLVVGQFETGRYALRATRVDYLCLALAAVP